MLRLPKHKCWPSPGKKFKSVSDTVRMQSTAIDENYLVVGTHLDSSIKQKIINHEYVDFAHLLPKDRITKEEDHCMDIINKGSDTYFVPVSDRENTGITSHTKWEQAFRYYPDRATELIQYTHIIFSAAQTFAWDNVYMYDKEFRIHLSNYPQRSWAVILQQAWSMCLHDKVKTQISEEFRGSAAGGNKKSKKEPCHRFNKGICTAGALCHYDHRCTVPTCGKWGHGAHICRKRLGVNGQTSGSVPPMTATPNTATQTSAQKK